MFESYLKQIHVQTVTIEDPPKLELPQKELSYSPKPILFMKKKQNDQNDIFSSQNTSKDSPSFEEYLISQRLSVRKEKFTRVSSKLPVIGERLRSSDSIFRNRSSTSETKNRNSSSRFIHDSAKKKISPETDSKPLSQLPSISSTRRIINLDQKSQPTVTKSHDFLRLPSKNSIATSSLISDWLRRQKHPPNSRVFQVNDAYPELKACLRARGWVENTEQESPVFHLKFELKNKDIDYVSLEPFQIVNHFEKATALTTKSGLCHNIKQIGWAADLDRDAIFPRCYDFAKDEDFQEFLEYFKQTAAESIIKRFFEANKSNSRETSDKQRVVSQTKISSLDNSVIALIQQVEAAVHICSQRLGVSEDDVDLGLYPDAVGSDEWSWIKSELPMIDFAELVGQGRAVSPSKQVHIAQNTRRSPSPTRTTQPTVSSRPLSPRLKECSLAEWVAHTVTQVGDLLTKLAEKFPQTYINGNRNIWILKPSGLSRGRGISLHGCLNTIISKARLKPALQSSGIQQRHIMHNSFVVQKYIESPLLYSGRKIDFRVWVLVTSWNPLIVWKYEEGYVRITSHAYNLNKLNDHYSHLTNNSINKHARNFRKEECFMTQEKLATHLSGVFGGEDIFSSQIEPKMREIIVGTLLCGQDSVEHRSNSAEIYGYDFCFDDRLGVWLIEINASPAWDYSSVECVSTRL